jgi:hypothetical protein
VERTRSLFGLRPMWSGPYLTDGTSVDFDVRVIADCLNGGD